MFRASPGLTRNRALASPITSPVDKNTDAIDPARTADALGTLRARSEVSRSVMILVAVGGVLVAAFLMGMLWRSVSSGIKNAPTIPQVGV